MKYGGISVKRTILSLYMNDSSLESKHKLLEFYRFALCHGVDDIVLLTRDILKGNRNGELKNFIGLIPNFGTCRTHLLLSRSDLRTLSANEVIEALGDRSDIDLIAGSKLVINFGGRRINCINGFDSSKYSSIRDFEDLNEVVYEQEPDVDITVIASSKHGGFNKKYLQDHHIVLYAAPLKEAPIAKSVVSDEFSVPLIGFTSKQGELATAFYGQLGYDGGVTLKEVIAEKKFNKNVLDYQDNGEAIRRLIKEKEEYTGNRGSFVKK